MVQASVMPWSCDRRVESQVDAHAGPYFVVVGYFAARCESSCDTPHVLEVLLVVVYVAQQHKVGGIVGSHASRWRDRVR
jgi:hypothetical protein